MAASAELLCTVACQAQTYPDHPAALP